MYLWTEQAGYPLVNVMTTSDGSVVATQVRPITVQMPINDKIANYVERVLILLCRDEHGEKKKNNDKKKKNTRLGTFFSVGSGRNGGRREMVCRSDVHHGERQMVRRFDAGRLVEARRTTNENTRARRFGMADRQSPVDR